MTSSLFHKPPQWSILVSSSETTEEVGEVGGVEEVGGLELTLQLLRLLSQALKVSP